MHILVSSRCCDVLYTLDSRSSSSLILNITVIDLR
jgi:hypothetical protein